MNELQLTEHVRSALDDATAGLRAPAGAAARAQHRGRRRRAGRGLLAVVPAAAAVAGVLVAVHGGSAPAAGSTASGAGPAAAVQTDAFVTRQVEKALGAAGGYIIRTSATSGPGQVTTSYLDPTTGTTRSVVSGAGDKAAYWVQTTVSGGEDHWRTTYVDYTARTWWTKTSHSARLGQDTSDVPVLNAQTTPAQLSRALAAGDLRIGEKAEVNGHAAIELVYAGHFAAKADAVRFWVDAKTFQPIRIDFPPFTAASSIAESWIAKSAANTAQTDKPQIPAGFRQVPPSKSFN